MRIVCLIKHEPPFVYFVNRVHAEHGVSLVVVESPSARRRLRRKRRSRGTGGIWEIARNRSRRLARRGRFADDYRTHFGDSWEAIDPAVPVLHTENINAPEVHERLAAERPDLILDHGSSIVDDRILDTAGLALNLHWGLSPYYRGTDCTDWALINWDPFNIGVTIHKLTRIIDGGSVLAQARATVEPDDTVNSINMQLTRLGTDLVVRAISKLEAGEELAYVAQDRGLGFLDLSRNWSSALRRHVEFIEDSGTVARMLRTPARKQKLPIVELE